MVGCVRDQGSRQMGEWLWCASKRSNAGGDDDPACTQRFSIVKVQLESARRHIHARDYPRLNRQIRLAQKPLAIINEILQRNFSRHFLPDEISHGMRHFDDERASFRRFVFIQREAAPRIRDMGGHARGSQEHAGGHLTLPERHRFA